MQKDLDSRHWKKETQHPNFQISLEWNCRALSYEQEGQQGAFWAVKRKESKKDVTSKVLNGDIMPMIVWLHDLKVHQNLNHNQQSTKFISAKNV